MSDFNPFDPDYVLHAIQSDKVRADLASFSSTDPKEADRTLEFVFTPGQAATSGRYVVTVGDKEWTYETLKDAVKRYCRGK